MASFNNYVNIGGRGRGGRPNVTFNVVGMGNIWTKREGGKYRQIADVIIE